jgi:hypothetical protein
MARGVFLFYDNIVSEDIALAGQLGPTSSFLITDIYRLLQIGEWNASFLRNFVCPIYQASKLSVTSSLISLIVGNTTDEVVHSVYKAIHVGLVGFLI